MSELDPPVFTEDLMRAMGIQHPCTLRRHIKAKKVPPYDKVITQKTRYWFRSTLVKHGLLPPMEAHAAAPSQPTPAG